MKRALLSLLLAMGPACSPAPVETESSSSSGGFGSLGGFGANSLGSNGSGSGSTTTHAIGGTSSGTPGTSGSNSASSATTSESITTSTSGGSTITNAASSGSGTTAASSSTGGANLAATTASGSSGGVCIPTGEFAGIGEGSLCCTGIADSAGYCSTTATTASMTTGTVGTTGSGSTVGGTGTTTGGTCPANMPNLETGETSTVAGPCSPTGDPCPNGFSCISGRCTLHGASGQLQVTMSWDDSEDLDLHVREPQASQPGGYCEIWYGNVGNREYPDGGANPDSSTGICTPVGWLDRDSNPACDFDDVDVENVIYPPNVTPPSGNYSVYADFWEDCAGDTDQLSGSVVPNYSTINYAIQVRRDGAVYQYCRSFTPNNADNGGQNAGTEVNAFTLP